MATKDLKTLNDYKIRFKNLNLEELQLLEGEILVHCIDSKSFNGKYYIPEWAVSNMGRGYSLYHNKWLQPFPTGTKREYYSFKGKKTVKVHQLVVNYFKNESDIIALEEFGADGIDAHHIIPINIPEELKEGTPENADARIKHCMECNCKSNIVYQEKTTDHKNDKRITNGRHTIEEEQGTAEWDNVTVQFRGLASRSGKLSGNSNGSYFIYSRDTDGTLKRENKMIVNLKGSN